MMSHVDIDKTIRSFDGEFGVIDVAKRFYDNVGYNCSYTNVTNWIDKLVKTGKLKERFTGMKYVYKNVSESALRQEMEMEEDNYQVNVILSFDSSGHHDRLFPDTNGTLQFDAKDCHIDAVLEQFTTFLRMIGYVIDSDQKLKLVKAD